MLICQCSSCAENRATLQPKKPRSTSTTATSDTTMQSPLMPSPHRGTTRSPMPPAAPLEDKENCLSNIISPGEDSFQLMKMHPPSPSPQQQSGISPGKAMILRALTSPSSAPCQQSTQQRIDQQSSSVTTSTTFTCTTSEAFQAQDLVSEFKEEWAQETITTTTTVQEQVEIQHEEHHSLVKEQLSHDYRCDVDADEILSFTAPSDELEQQEQQGFSPASSDEASMAPAAASLTIVDMEEEVSLASKKSGGSMGSGKRRVQNTRKPTVPKTPAFMRRASKQRTVETTEERETREAEEMRQRTLQRIQANRDAREAAYLESHALNSGISHSVRPLTIPKTPKITKTAPRQRPVLSPGSQPMEHTSAEECNTWNRKLRNSISEDLVKQMAAYEKRKGKLTQPISPVFLTDQRAKLRQTTSKQAREEAVYRTSREECSQWATKLRDRSSEELSRAVEIARNRPKTTKGVAPTFHSDARAQAYEACHKPAQTKEEAELEEMKKQFKARPFNNAVFENSGMIGVPNVESHRVTVAQPFKLSSRSSSVRRASESEDSESTDMAGSSFKARPSMDWRRHSVMGPARSTRPLTVPVSPEFHQRPQAKRTVFVDQDQEELSKQFKARPFPASRRASCPSGAYVQPRAVTEARSPNLSKSNRSSRHEDEEQQAKPFKARPAPQFHRNSMGGSSQELRTVRVTKPQPFKLNGEMISLAKKEMMMARMQAERESEEKQRDFVARPLPSGDLVTFHPSASTRPLTEFQEFQLHSLELHNRAMCEIQRRNELEQDLEQQQRGFHARALPESTYEPSFIPEPSSRPPLMPSETVLHSDTRAAKRKEYDEAQKRRLEELKAKEEADELERERQEAMQMKELYNTPLEVGGLKFTARPLPETTISGPSFIPSASTKDLTIPITPEVLRRVSRSNLQGTGIRGGAVRVATDFEEEQP